MARTGGKEDCEINMPKILIVDDEYSIRTLFQYMFKDAGYEVVTAKNGKDALEKINDFTPDIMLVDIAMPEMDGTTFILGLKKLAVTRGELAAIPFLVLTGENYMKVGAHYAFQNNPSCRSFLPKMTPPETVLGLAGKILGLPK